MSAVAPAPKRPAKGIGGLRRPSLPRAAQPARQGMRVKGIAESAKAAHERGWNGATPRQTPREQTPRVGLIITPRASDRQPPPPPQTAKERSPPSAARRTEHSGGAGKAPVSACEPPAAVVVALQSETHPARTSQGSGSEEDEANNQPVVSDEEKEAQGAGGGRDGNHGRGPAAQHGAKRKGGQQGASGEGKHEDKGEDKEDGKGKLMVPLGEDDEEDEDEQEGKNGKGGLSVVPMGEDDEEDDGEDEREGKDGKGGLSVLSMGEEDEEGEEDENEGEGKEGQGGLSVVPMGEEDEDDDEEEGGGGQEPHGGHSTVPMGEDKDVEEGEGEGEEGLGVVPRDEEEQDEGGAEQGPQHQHQQQADKDDENENEDEDEEEIVVVSDQKKPPAAAAAAAASSAVVQREQDKAVSSANLPHQRTNGAVGVVPLEEEEGEGEGEEGPCAGPAVNEREGEREGMGRGSGQKDANQQGPDEGADDNDNNRRRPTVPSLPRPGAVAHRRSPSLAAGAPPPKPALRPARHSVGVSKPDEQALASSRSRRSVGLASGVQFASERGLDGNSNNNRPTPRSARQGSFSSSASSSRRTDATPRSARAHSVGARRSPRPGAPPLARGRSMDSRTSTSQPGGAAEYVEAVWTIAGAVSKHTRQGKTVRVNERWLKKKFEKVRDDEEWDVSRFKLNQLAKMLNPNVKFTEINRSTAAKVRLSPESVLDLLQTNKFVELFDDKEERREVLRQQWLAERQARAEEREKERQQELEGQRQAIQHKVDAIEKARREALEYLEENVLKRQRLEKSLAERKEMTRKHMEEEINQRHEREKQEWFQEQQKLAHAKPKRTGVCGGMDEHALRSIDVDDFLKKSWAVEQARVRMLVLGPEGAGKSTVFRQMRKLFGKPLDTWEEKQRTLIVHRCIVTNAQLVIAQIEKWGLQHVVEHHDALSAIEALSAEKAVVDEDVGRAVKEFWSDPAVKQVWKRRHEFHVAEATSFLFDNIDRISSLEYTATHQDFLHTRVRTTGMVTTHYDIGSVRFEVSDVSGQRNKRQKWLHCFSDATVVLFVAAVSEYNQAPLADGSSNRLEEALNDFAEACGNEHLADASMILFLNKYDLFARKVADHPVRLVPAFADCEGDTAQDGVAYFKKRFRAVADQHDRVVLVHVTSAIDTGDFQRVFKVCKDYILNRSIDDAGF